jgi:sulfite exporter TauE/SafE/copper chaperone CopZ
MKTYTFHVHGMHCKSCSLVIEQELSDLSYVESVHADSHKHMVTVTGDFEGVPQEELAKDFSMLLSSKGYTFSVEKKEHTAVWRDFKIAIPISLVFIIFFVALQKMGIVNTIGGGEITFSTVFFIGVIASLSTCMAVVGGLVLSMSATFAKEGDKIKPQLMFHIGRVVSFFVLGGVIGAIGSAFTLNTTSTFILNIIIGVVMLILGINLLDVFPWVKKLQLSMPKFIGKHAHGVSRLNHTLTPLLVGIATFFLPCGFTQSMQLYTLSTGNFLSGGLTMLIFALGTLPVLALVSFSSFSIQNSSKSGVFFKTAGIIVIVFALFNLINSLVIIGLVPPLFNF